MQFTLATDYGLRMLMYLATVEDREPVPVARVAESFAISSEHLMKVAQRLSGLGWIELVRGRHGGARLAIDPAAITVRDILIALEPFELVECFGHGGGCALTPACRLSAALHDAKRAFLESLRQHTLAELVDRPKYQPLLSIRIGP